MASILDRAATSQSAQHQPGSLPRQESSGPSVEPQCSTVGTDCHARHVAYCGCDPDT